MKLMQTLFIETKFKYRSEYCSHFLQLFEKASKRIVNYTIYQEFFFRAKNRFTNFLFFFYKKNHTVEKIVKNTMVGIFHCFLSQYEISFQIKPVSITSGWSSILHLTARSNNRYMGDRIPAVFFYPGTTQLHVCSAIGNNRNYCFTTRQALPRNRFTKVNIRQIYDKTKRVFVFAVLINGKQVSI